ncbi:hypothetical protein [Devriesea agamarum]|uniref:hypothetical protein n=1 Tax=Devriesea agamarum TaxID=472569 RepID=UPI0012EE71C6|nr:hypothetical protein [Devriesea agamarum]
MSMHIRPNSKPAWQKTFKKRLACSVILVMATILGIVLASPYLDSIAIEEWRCQVLSARGDTTVTGNKGSVTTYDVLIETKNCGQITFYRGVNSQNKDEIAKSFLPGREYVFEVGWYSRIIMLNFVPHGIPAAQSYRFIG